MKFMDICTKEKVDTEYEITEKIVGVNQHLAGDTPAFF